jgi:hypothetical protein
MDEKCSDYGLKAPGASGDSMRLPGRSSFPRVDDHLVEPEVTRDEIINGRRVVAMPAEAPHAIWHGPRIQRGGGPADPARGEKSDFASDACIFKDGIDPATGARYLEEIAFEVVSGQRERDVTEKAVGMHRRGVRRIFAVFVKGPRLCEWSPESQGWRPLDASSSIEDRCLVKPLAVAALLDAALADNAVAEALIAKGNPTILKREAAAKASGKAEGRVEGRTESLTEGRVKGVASSILAILEERGIAVSAAQREKIMLCSDFDRLNHVVAAGCVGSFHG